MEIVAFDVAEIMRIGAEIGLLLNVTKCALIAHSEAMANNTLHQSFNPVEIENVIFQVEYLTLKDNKQVNCQVAAATCPPPDYRLSQKRSISAVEIYS